MRTIETKAYTINELSDKAKQTAHEYHLHNKEYVWLDEWLESLNRGLSEFNFDVKDYSIDAHCPGRSHVNIQFNGDEDILELEGVRLWKYLRANGYEYIKNIHTKNIDNIHDDTCPMTGYCGDVDFLIPIKSFMERPTKGTTLEDLMESCVESILQGIKTDVEFQDSLEFFIDECEANELEFTEEGDLI